MTKRRKFTNEYKADAVKLYLDSEESLPVVAKNLGIVENTFRRWVKQAEIDAGNGPEGAYTTSEKAEIRRLKRELRQANMERDFLKKAAAYFARETEN
jgi:transposase